MDELGTQLGVGGILAVLIVREFANFARSRKSDGGNDVSTTQIMRRLEGFQIESNRNDEFFRKSLERTLEKLIELHEQQNELLERLVSRERRL